MKTSRDFTKKVIELFWKKVSLPKDRSKCWEWAACKEYGYGRLSLWLTPKDRRTFQAHRFSYEIHNNGIPNGLYVLHKCNNRGCVNPGHLYAGTHQQNMDDMIRSNSSLKGEKSPTSKLTAQQVLEIRSKYYPRKYSTYKLAGEYNVNQALIWRIIHNLVWTHV